MICEIMKGMSKVTISDIILFFTLLVLFFTLLVLIWQTRENIRSIQMSQYQDALRMMFDVRSEIISKPEIIEEEQEHDYFNKVYLAAGGKQRYYYKLKLFHAFEVFFLLHENKVITSDMWLSWSNNIQTTLKSESNRKIWSMMRQHNIFNEEFAKFVDSLIIKNGNV